jgi:hypothetical protein
MLQSFGSMIAGLLWQSEVSRSLACHQLANAYYILAIEFMAFILHPDIHGKA